MRAERGHQPAANVVALPGGGQAAHLAQILLRARRVAGDVGQRLVLDDAAARQILVLRFLLAPGGQRLEATQDIGLAAGDADALPGFGRIILVIGRIADPLHFLVEPVAAPGLAQLFQHLGEDFDQIGDVADRIVDLALVERAARPVSEPCALVELHAEPGVDEVAIADLFAKAERHGGDLGVEHRMRRLAGQIMDDLDVLAAGMEDLEHVLIIDQQVEQGRKVDARRLGIDRRGLAGVGDLDQTEFGPVAILAHELGIHRDIGGFGHAGAEIGKRLAVGNQRMNLHMVFDLIMGWPASCGLVDSRQGKPIAGPQQFVISVKRI